VQLNELDFTGGPYGFGREPAVDSRWLLSRYGGSGMGEGCQVAKRRDVLPTLGVLALKSPEGSAWLTLRAVRKSLAL
jgi:hypothetical protein